MAPPQSQSTSMQRLHYVEKRIVRLLELAGGVMEELANPQVREEMPWPGTAASSCNPSRFVYLQDIQETLREEIKSACEYRPFEKCDYSARISNEICCKKLEYVLALLDGMEYDHSQCMDES